MANAGEKYFDGNGGNGSLPLIGGVADTEPCRSGVVESHHAIEEESPSQSEGAEENPQVCVHFRYFDILLLTLRNAILNIVTLTMYRFWGRTRVRRYLWGHTSFAGDPLEYTGNGLELFGSFFVVLLVFFTPFISFQVLTDLFLAQNNPLLQIYTAVTICAFFFLFGVAAYRAQGYRLSRSDWRGIRLGLKGSSIEFGVLNLAYSFLSISTLLWTVPMQRLILANYLFGNIMFGDRPVRFRARLAPLYSRFIGTWFITLLGLLAVIWGVFWAIETVSGSDIQQILDNLSDFVLAPDTLGQYLIYGVILGGAFIALTVIIAISTAWYRAFEYRYFFSCLSFETLRFKLNVHPLSLIWLNVVNALIVYGTLGIARPVAQMRRFRYFITRLEVKGRFDFSVVGPSETPYPLIGEGLADFFEIGAV